MRLLRARISPPAAAAQSNLSFFLGYTHLMKPPPRVRAYAHAAANGGDPEIFHRPGDIMTSKKQQLVRKPSRKIADSRRIRYGAGNAPRVVRPLDAATQDSKAIRFGAGNCPASLRK
jgi:hypothetical protein